MKINIQSALLYMTTVAMLGVIAELIIGTGYNFVFDEPLWEYTVWPIHNAYTSLYAPFLWAIYGLQIYLIHDTLRSKHITSLKILVPLICIEAIIFEALVNLGFLAAFGQFIYYYFPSDLFHLTSVQTLPFYLLAGFVITGTLSLMRKRPNSCIVLNIAITYLVVMVF